MRSAVSVGVHSDWPCGLLTRPHLSIQSFLLSTRNQFYPICTRAGEKVSGRGARVCRLRKMPAWVPSQRLFGSCQSRWTQLFRCGCFRGICTSSLTSSPQTHQVPSCPPCSLVESYFGCPGSLVRRGEIWFTSPLRRSSPNRSLFLL